MDERHGCCVSPRHSVGGVGGLKKGVPRAGQDSSSSGVNSEPHPLNEAGFKGRFYYKVLYRTE